MDAKQLAMALLYLAAFGGVILVASKVVGNVGRKAAANLP